MTNQVEDEEIYVSPELACIYFLSVYDEEKEPEMSLEQYELNKARVKSALDAAVLNGFKNQQKLLSVVKSHHKGNSSSSMTSLVALMREMFTYITPMDFLAAAGFNSSPVSIKHELLH